MADERPKMKSKKIERRKAERMKLNRKQIGVKLDNDLWHKFKVACLEEKTTAALKLEELISDYLQNKK